MPVGIEKMAATTRLVHCRFGMRLCAVSARRPAGAADRLDRRAHAAAELAESPMVALTVGSREIALYHPDGGEIRATGNICTHGHAYLTDGWLTGEGLIECPLHAGCFDVRTGAGQADPITEDLAVYPVRREGDSLMLPQASAVAGASRLSRSGLAFSSSRV